MKLAISLTALVLGVLLVGCQGEPEAAPTTGTATTSPGTGKKGVDLGSSDATPLMSNAEAEKRVGSALGNK